VTGTTETAFQIINETGRGPAVLLCEHASALIPPEYHGLGLAEEDLHSHAVWDPGALALAEALSAALDAPLVAGAVSRLVYDCNRPPEAPSAMPERSERIAVPGNAGLSPEARAARVAQVYAPFCDAVDRVLAARQAQGTPFALVTLHSFTPLWHGTPREVELGLLHDADSRLADAMLDHAATLPHRILRRNAPYGPEDGVTHSLQRHGLRHGLPNVMIEARNDLLADAAAVEAMADELLTLLRPAFATLGLTEAHHA